MNFKNLEREKFLNQNIISLLLTQSIPAIIGMIVMSIYNLIDTIFIGNAVGYMGIAALSLVLPIQIIQMAFSQTLGVGSASIISRALGKNDTKKAEETLGSLIFLIIILGLFFTIFNLIFSNEILSFFGSQEEILPLSKEYFDIIILGTIFIFITSAGNNIIRAQGHAKFAMILIVSGALINIILDPIFIFYFNMGIRGAALATVLSQFVSFLFTIYYFFNKKNQIAIKKENIRLNMNILKEKISIGISTFIKMVSNSALVVLVNNALIVYGGSIYIAIFGIYIRLIMLITMPIFGFVQGLQPIVGFNFGAKKYDRVKKSTKFAIYYSTFICIFCFVLVFLFPEVIFLIFGEDPDLISKGVSSLKIMSFSLPTLGFTIIVAGFYQSIGDSKKAFLISILRQLFLLIPFIIILPLFFSLNGVWYSFPLSDLVSFIFAIFLFFKDMKNMK